MAISKICKMLCTFLMMSCFLTGCSSGKYADIIYNNWGIMLPNDWKEIYEYQSDSSSLGDGERYHVFECDDFETVANDIDWEKSKNENVENMILSTIEGFSIKSDYVINFQSEYEYFYKQKNDNSKLLIVHILESNLVYIIENFM